MGCESCRTRSRSWSLIQAIAVAPGESVGVATLAVGLALVVRIRESYGTIEDESINSADYAMDRGESGR